MLENELKRIYCNILQAARYTTTLIAESSGYLAARANNLPLCHRLKPNSDYFLIQKCKSTEIRVEAKKTQCGFEPYYENQTIGKDGFPPHSFRECFWEDGIVNLNGKTHTWEKSTREWEYVNPTHHHETLRLGVKFNELTDMEANYQLNPHEFYQWQEVQSKCNK